MLNKFSVGERGDHMGVDLALLERVKHLIEEE